ncbi:MAG: hypothetical protein HHJ14_05755 [Cellulomonas sp.]|nr:hypothetical protein [Cellulomonas sp.]
MTTTDERADALRAWARGMTTLEAATELLIRWHDGAFVAPGRPWMRREADGAIWVDFDVVPDRVGMLSGGERRVLLAATSLAAGRPVDLSDVASGLDRSGLDLFLAAIAHGSGAGVLHPWPARA